MVNNLLFVKGKTGIQNRPEVEIASGRIPVNLSEKIVKIYSLRNDNNNLQLRYKYIFIAQIKLTHRKNKVK